jgi:exodeoxyribonuclease V gamma subunit
MLTGALDRVHPQGVHPKGVFRAVLNPNGRHGGHAVRHGLDWLVASAHGLPLYELSAEKKGATPRILVRAPLPPDDARRALSSLQALRGYGMARPLCFLPKSGHAWWLTAQIDPGKALAEAQKVWGGGDDDFGGPGEARAATLMALRGRDPFLDGDADSLDAFELLSHLIFSAVERGEAFDEGSLP